MYSLYYDNYCQDNAHTVGISYEKEEDLIMHPWWYDNGVRKPIRSISIPAASMIELFTEENY